MTFLFAGISAEFISTAGHSKGYLSLLASTVVCVLSLATGEK